MSIYDDYENEIVRYYSEQGNVVTVGIVAILQIF